MTEQGGERRTMKDPLAEKLRELRYSDHLRWTWEDGDAFAGWIIGLLPLLDTEDERDEKARRQLDRIIKRIEERSRS